MAVTSMSPPPACKGVDASASARRFAWTLLLLDQSPPPPPSTQQSPPPLPEVSPTPHHRGHFRYSLWGMEHNSGVKIFAPFLGHWVTLGHTIEVHNFVRSPLQTAFAIALASILAIKWERHLALIRRR
jgi:hypothetical protein